MILPQFDTILLKNTCFSYGIFGPFLCANCQFKYLAGLKNLLLEGLTLQPDLSSPLCLPLEGASYILYLNPAIEDFLYDVLKKKSEILQCMKNIFL